jgi:hypothetical protein
VSKTGGTLLCRSNQGAYIKSLVRNAKETPLAQGVALDETSP